MATQSFKNFINDAGYDAPSNIIPGKIVAFPGLDKRKGNTAARCFLFPDMRGGWLCDFSTGLFEVWQAKRETPYTKAERQAFKAQCERDRLAREQETIKAHQAAVQKAVHIWRQSTPITEQYQHAYLIKKRIKPHAVRLFRDVLVVPIYDENRQLVNLQFIDANGTKRFLTGGRKRGCFSVIGKVTDTILVCEGYATGVSLFEDSGYLTVVALDAGNLEPVARVVRRLYPGAEIIICGDNDFSGTGQAAARAAALSCGGKYLLPPIIGDWNDHLTMEGAV